MHINIYLKLQTKIHYFLQILGALILFSEKSESSMQQSFFLRNYFYVRLPILFAWKLVDFDFLIVLLSCFFHRFILILLGYLRGLLDKRLSVCKLKIYFSVLISKCNPFRKDVVYYFLLVLVLNECI